MEIHDFWKNIVTKKPSLPMPLNSGAFLGHFEVNKHL
jgi:hypothetical protein